MRIAAHIGLKDFINHLQAIGIDVFGSVTCILQTVAQKKSKPSIPVKAGSTAPCIPSTAMQIGLIAIDLKDINVLALREMAAACRTDLSQQLGPFQVVTSE